MILIRNDKSVIGGHLLQYTTPGSQYVAHPVRFGRVRNYAIRDDRDTRIIVSNRVRREFFA